MHGVEVDWGDGASEPVAVTAGAFTLSHVWADDGAYDVVVSVDDGADVTVVHVPVTVTNVAPTAVVGALVSAPEGSAWTLPLTAGDAGAGDLLSGEVRWSSSEAFTPLDVTRGAFDVAHTYPQEGSYEVTVRVGDDDGALVQVQATAVVTNVAPALALGLPASLAEGGALSRAVSFADPGADTWSATIDWGDGTPGEVRAVTAGAPFTLAHTYADDGDYTLALVVDDGTTTTRETLAVSVANVAPSVDAGGAATLLEGGALVRQGTISDPGASDTFSATVDWGEGAGPEPLTLTGRGFELAHTFTRDGDYTVVVDVADHRGAHGQASFVVHVDNVAPVVAAGVDVALVEGDTLTRTVTFGDPGADSWSATVDWGDGSALATPSVDGAARSLALSHRYRQDGVYTVVVTVADGVASASDSFVVTASNALPVVAIGADVHVAEGSPFTRGGSFTDAGPDDAHVVTVTYGDGGASQQLAHAGGAFTLSRTFGDDGAYPVEVRVSDDDGATTRAITVTAGNVAPSLTLPAPASVAAATRWQASASFTDPGADTFSATIDYDDGSALVSLPSVAGSVALDHTWPVAGAYDVVVRVTDDDGGFDEEVVRVTVLNVAPTVTGGPAVNLPEGASAVVTATYTDPGTNTHSATIRWTAGGAHEPATVDAPLASVSGSHVYDDNGSHQALVTVTDQGGLSGTATVAVTVTNVAPVVDAGADVRAIPDRRVQKTVSFTDPGSDTWTATANYGDGTGTQALTVVGRTALVDHTYTSDGVFTVTVTVQDDDLGAHTDSFTVDARYQDCAGLDLTGAALWVGGAAANPTSWHTSDNWRDKSVPSAATPVVVCANLDNAPAVTSANASAARVTLASEAAITVTSPRTLTVAGAVAGGQVLGTGTVRMNADGATLATPVPNLALLQDTTLAADVAVAGAVDVAAQARLDLAGRTLALKGNLTVASGGAVGDTSGVVRLEGSAPQTVTLAEDAARLPSVVLDNSAGASLAQTTRIGGLLTVTRGALSASAGASVVLAGASLPVVGVGGSYLVDTTEVASAITLGANYTFARAQHLLVVRPEGALVIGTRTLTLGGHLTVYHGVGAGLVMTQAAGVVVVGGAATFDSVPGATTPQSLGAGTIKLQGDLVALDSGASGDASLTTGGTLLRFEGSAGKVHAVRLPAGVSHVGDVVVDGQRTLDLGGDEAWVYGSFSHVGPALATIRGGTLQAADVDVDHAVFDACTLAVFAPDASTDLDDTSFVNQAPDASQLSIEASGGGFTLALSGLVFAAMPTTGRLLEATNDGAGTLTIGVSASTPRHGAPWSAAGEGVVLSWGTASDDTDADGLADAAEFIAGTDPLEQDTDGDSSGDGLEVALGADPLDAQDAPLSFGAPQTQAMPSGSGSVEIVVADLSGDANKEIVVAHAGNPSAYASIVSVGAATLSKVDISRAGGNGTDMIAVGRLVGTDTQLDLGSFDADDKKAYFAERIGANWGMLGQTMANGITAYDCAAANIDNAVGDELVLLRDNGGNANLLVVTASGTSASFGLSLGPARYIAKADIDGAFTDDFIVGGSGTGASVTIYTTTGNPIVNGPFAVYQTLTFAGPIRGVTSGDIDADGTRGDVAVIVDATPDVVYVAYRTAGTNSYTTTGPFAVAEGAATLSVGDLDGNGRPDLATASQGADEVTLLMQLDGGRAFVAAPFEGLDGAGEAAVVISDVDNDGDLDLVTLDKTTNVVAVTRQ